MSSSVRQRKSRTQSGGPSAQGDIASNRTFLLLAALVVAALFVFSYLDRMNELAAVRSQIVALEEDVAQAQQRTAELEATLGEVAGPAYVDATARSELGLIQPGDDAFVVLESDAASADPRTAPVAASQSEAKRAQGINIFDLEWWQSLFGR